MEEILARLHPFSQVRLFKKGSTILFQGEIPRRGYIVRDGVVCAYTVKASGEQMIVGFFSKGDVLPLPWLLETSSTSMFYYEALEDTRVSTFSKVDFDKVIAEDPALLKPLLKFLSNQYTAQLVRITALGQSRAVEKISFTLYYLVFRYGVEKRPGIYTLSIKLSHLIIANLTGLTRESTTTNLKTLKSKGIVSYTRPTFTIDKAKLERFIGEDGFRELSL